MSQNRAQSKGVNGARTLSLNEGSVDEQRRLSIGINQATTRMKWTKEMNIVVMGCFYIAESFDENGVPIKVSAEGRRGNGKKEKCLTSLKRDCVTRSELSEKISGCQWWNWGP